MHDAALSLTGSARRHSVRRLASEWRDRVLPTATAAATGGLWKLGSLTIALVVWQLACATFARDFPTPLASLRVAVELLASPFSTVPGHLGIGYQLLASLRRIGVGFTASAALAIPAGVVIGVSPACRKLFDPIVQVLRPVSPLVWFPLALVMFKALGGVSSATLFTIFVTSFWPILINTAAGVSSLPADYRTVARVFHFSPLRYLTKILLPHTLPYIIVGLRLSMGNAWLVIVAAEMLSGDIGIGFFAWDSYNAGSYERMIAAVAAIGAIGLLLDRAFTALHRHFDYQGASR